MRGFFFTFVSNLQIMSTQRIASFDLPKYLLLILYIITGSLSNFGAIDILAPQWIYLGAINILSCLYFLFIAPKSLDTAFGPLIKSHFIYVYLFYILWNCLSYFYAINPVETLINLPRITNTFFAIFLAIFLSIICPINFSLSVDYSCFSLLQNQLLIIMISQPFFPLKV